MDPYSNNKITFSECVHLLSSEMVLIPMGARNDSDGDQKVFYRQELQQMAILEHLSAAHPSGRESF